MALFITKFDVGMASEEQIILYYEEAAQKINLLLEKYDIRDANAEFAYVTAAQLQSHTTLTGFFQTTILKLIFFDQKQPFVPEEIVQVFRCIVSDAPQNIKVVFLNTFIKLLLEGGWDKSLSDYFKKQYDFPSDGIILVDELQDFSLSSGIYKITFELRASKREQVTLFLKQAQEEIAYNELLYFQMAKELFPTENYIDTPVILPGGDNNKTLLLCPEIPGIISDKFISAWYLIFRTTENIEHKLVIKNVLEIIIEIFVTHAALGDLLGRNDRHLMNSIINFINNKIMPINIIEDLDNSEKFLTCSQYIIENKAEAISLIDIDFKWLLEEKNNAWILIDIDFGHSELNLLSLLPEFNDFDPSKNLYLEQRKNYVAHIFKIYSQTLSILLEKRHVLLSMIHEIYPENIAKRKLNFIKNQMDYFENSKDFVVAIFKRYLLNYRVRKVYKDSLWTLYNNAQKSNNYEILTTLKETNLLRYLPYSSKLIPSELNVFLQLECFRGALSKIDAERLNRHDISTWESVADNILEVTEKFDQKLFQGLKGTTQFIEEDVNIILEDISSHYSEDASLSLSDRHSHSSLF